MHRDPTNEALTDLLRSAWVIESARAHVYRRWASVDAAFAAAADRAEEGAGIVAASMPEPPGRGDTALVEPHSRWIGGLVGPTPGDTPLSDWFLARLGDWVEAHAGDFLNDGKERLTELRVEDKLSLTWPGGMPAPPPFEPLPEGRAEPPGDVIFRFGILGDLHIGSPRGEATAVAAIADLNASGAELVVQLGDITDHGNKAEFERAASLLAGLQMPWHVMLGNHDMYSYEEERLAGREYFPALFGRAADGALVEHRGWRFAVLDSAENATSPFAPYNLVTGQFADGPGGAIVRGALTVSQHEILAELAAPGAPPAFVFLHHPPQPFTSFPPIVFGLRDSDSGRLHAVCDSGNVWGVFAGHTHRNAQTDAFGDVVVQEVAIARDFPFGFALVDVTESGYAYNFHQISDEGLLRSGYEKTGVIQRRYAQGLEAERAFSWVRRSP